MSCMFVYRIRSFSKAIDYELVGHGANRGKIATVPYPVRFAMLSREGPLFER
jgi:hypothetical protein